MSEFIVHYHPAVLAKDIPRLDQSVRVMIKKSIESKLAVHPDIYGKPLGGNLQGLRSHRVGDWRVIFRIGGAEILILHIGHRRDVYHALGRRIET
jgi:mRNA-degrading endonuclease RelE of RelBE toxin-antitoxin system